MKKNINYIWYSGLEEPDEQREILVEYISKDTIKHDVVYYHKDTDSFLKDSFIINDVIKWCYLDELIKLIGKSSWKNHYVNKENNDERLRKTTISFLKDFADKGYENAVECIDWLEKQSKQKPIIDGILTATNFDKIFQSCKVHKFNVGDWVVFNNKHQSIYQIEKIEDGYYILRHTHGGTFRVCVLHDESLRLWTIKDAKPGDILINKANDAILIFKNIQDNYRFSSYCDYFVNTFRAKQFSQWASSAFIPATKEQRDILFKKMYEAGYEWNIKKKQLMRIEL